MICLHDVSSYMINWLSDTVNSIFIDYKWDQSGLNLSNYIVEVDNVSSQVSQYMITMRKMFEEVDSPIVIATKSFDSFFRMDWILGTFELEMPPNDRPEVKSYDENLKYLERLRILEQEINASKQVLHQCWKDIYQRESDISNLNDEIQKLTHNQQLSNKRYSEESDSESDLIKEIKGYLECGICYSSFIDPMTLPCGHNVCRYCIRKMVILNEMHSVSSVGCPWCKHEVTQSISDIKTDKVLNDLVIILSSVS